MPILLCARRDIQYKYESIAFILASVPKTAAQMGTRLLQVQNMRLEEKYELITKTLIKRGMTITTMESCTAGLIASLLTDTEGSSAILKGAFVTYSNMAKVCQGVPEAVIQEHGVYSGETAAAMAAAARKQYKADIGVGVTGTMGNADPENADSIPGQVFYAIAATDTCLTFEKKIPVQKSRRMYKEQVAGLIADSLLAYLQVHVDCTDTGTVKSQDTETAESQD